MYSFQLADQKEDKKRGGRRHKTDEGKNGEWRSEGDGREEDKDV